MVVIEVFKKLIHLALHRVIRVVVFSEALKVGDSPWEN